MGKKLTGHSVQVTEMVVAGRKRRLRFIKGFMGGGNSYEG